MKRILLGSTTLAGVAAMAGAAQASDGVKLDVGGFFQTVYQGVFDKKSEGHFGNHRTTDHFTHNAEVWFKGETTLDNGLTVGARVELEAENANDQIDKSFVYWSGGFGKVQIGSQDGPIGGYCILPPGATANFSAFSPNVWGSNDPVGSNAACIDVLGNSQSIVYSTPSFSGFQLLVAYTPSNNAEDYTQAGVNAAGTPVIAEGTAKHSFAAYAMYNYAGDGWGIDWGGGGSWQTGFNRTGDTPDGRNQAYQTSGAFTFGSIAVGGVFQYFDQAGPDNDIWIAGAGAAYYGDGWGLGLQYSHGNYEGDFLGDGNGTEGAIKLNRVVATATYNLAPGIDLDADLGYTWYRDHRDAVPESEDDYEAFEVGLGSSLSF
jgi:hypothetical protein